MAYMPQVSPPEWTESRKKNGLDPLGMQNSSVALYQSLLPGISNVTLRIRYYGLYCWLADRYAREVGDTNPMTWQRHVRRAEALYALIAQHRGTETGVAGVTWAAVKLAQADSVVDFAEDAEPGSPTHYLKQAWGAYGAAYASQLIETRVLTLTDSHAIPVPGLGVGDRLAKAFATALGDLTNRFFAIVQRGNVTLQELKSLAPMTPSEIGVDSEERAVYEDLLFAKGARQEPNDEARRRTLTLILTLAGQLKRYPSSTDLRWALYADMLPDGSPAQWTNQELRDHRLKWWVYQLNDLGHICCEALLKYTLDILEAYPAGRSLPALIGEAVEGVVAALGVEPTTWGQFCTAVAVPSNAWQSADEGSEYSRLLQILRAARDGRTCQAPDALNALQLLAILSGRAAPAVETLAANLVGAGGGVARSIFTELGFLNGCVNDPFREVVTRLINERVVQRHLWIALRKLRYQSEYTFLIESDEGQVRLRQKDGPVQTTPRLDPAIAFLRDIHLLDVGGLTTLGTRLVQ